MTSLDYYKILRVKPTATPNDISSAYQNLLVLYDDNKSTNAEEIMELIDNAYSILRNPDTRANYDLERIAIATENHDEKSLSQAEKIIASWGEGFTTEEQEYLNKIHLFNKIIRAIIFVAAVIFVWSVISFRWDISVALIFAVVFVRVILGAVYKIKNPPPPPEVWAVK